MDLDIINTLFKIGFSDSEELNYQYKSLYIGRRFRELELEYNCYANIEDSRGVSENDMNKFHSFRSVYLNNPELVQEYVNIPDVDSLDGFTARKFEMDVLNQMYIGIEKELGPALLGKFVDLYGTPIETKSR